MKGWCNVLLLLCKDSLASRLTTNKVKINLYIRLLYWLRFNICYQFLARYMQLYFFTFLLPFFFVFLVAPFGRMMVLQQTSAHAPARFRTVICVEHRSKWVSLLQKCISTEGRVTPSSATRALSLSQQRPPHPPSDRRLFLFCSFVTLCYPPLCLCVIDLHVKQ